MLVFFILCIAVVAGIIYMKYRVMEPKSAASVQAVDTADRPMAIPDTTVDSSTVVTEPETPINNELPDTIIGKDRRIPYEAGYEDGYACGSDDGLLRMYQATYDETNSFTTRQEKEAYVRGYREGYDKGYKDYDQTASAPDSIHN